MKEKERFLEAYDNYAENLLRHVSFRVSDATTAEDITQETFLRVWGEVLRGAAIKNFKAYFYHVAHNLIIDYYRLKKSSSLEEAIQGGTEFPAKERNALETLAEKDLVARALAELDLKTRQIIMWRFLDNLTVSEIAEILGKTPGSISVTIHRGLKKIRVKIKNV